MKLTTEIFGEIEYLKEDVISFETGFYGFEDKHDFLYIPSMDEQFKFNWLQSLDDSSLVFIVTDPFLFIENYDFKIDDEVIQALNIEIPEDLSILSIVNVEDDVEKTTVNIKAPILINHATKIGKQVILTEDYPYKFFIFKKELNEGV